MNLALGIAGLVVTFLNVCVGAITVAIRLGKIAPSNTGKETSSRRLSFRPLSAVLRVGERVARSQRLQGVIITLGVVGAVLGAVFLQRAFATDGAAVRIISPSEGDVVAHEIAVEVETRSYEQEEFLLIFVRPLPGDPNQDYFLQEFPQPIGGRVRWDSRPVYVGAPDDQPGTPFDICAVLTRSDFDPGERARILPAGPFDCVRVNRE
jgi:hypothetical protein